MKRIYENGKKEMFKTANFVNKKEPIVNAY